MYFLYLTVFVVLNFKADIINERNRMELLLSFESNIFEEFWFGLLVSTKWRTEDKVNKKRIFLLKENFRDLLTLKGVKQKIVKKWGEG